MDINLSLVPYHKKLELHVSHPQNRAIITENDEETD